MPTDAEPTESARTEASSSPIRRWVKQFRLIWLAPILAVIALGAWAFASPLGSSPDDDFHLVSIWCADGGDDCAPGQQANTRVVPEALLESACYMADPNESAACQEPFDSGATAETKRGNFVGAYPPVYYGFMSLFAGDDLVASALLMRLVTILLFVGINTALFALMPRPRRSTLLWSWLISIVPLGLFLIASNNPSSWAIIGVGSSWLALLGWYETTGKRRIALGALFAVLTVMAAGARADAAVYVCIGILAVLVLTFERTRRFLLLSILPALALAVCVFFFLTSRQSSSGVEGFSGAVAGTPSREVGAAESGLGEVIGGIVTNLMNLPSLWAGVFGYWGLGWLDTFLPAGVLFATVGVFVAATFTGVTQLTWRKAIAIAGVLFALCLVPLYVLAQGGHAVGEQVQPRYLLPLIVVFAGLALLVTRKRPIVFNLAQRIVIAGALIAAFIVSLHINMRRYITGGDVNGGNLNANIEWWWDLGPSPMVVLAIGAIAWAALVIVVLRELGPRIQNEVVFAQPRGRV